MFQTCFEARNGKRKGKRALKRAGNLHSTVAPRVRCNHDLNPFHSIPPFQASGRNVLPQVPAAWSGKNDNIHFNRLRGVPHDSMDSDIDM